MNIGILVAVEFDAFYNIYGEPIEKFKHGYLEVFKYHIHGKDVYVAASNAGQIRASIAMTVLVEVYHCNIILNYGVVGALREQEVEELAVVQNVVHYDWDVSEVDVIEKGRYSMFDSTMIPVSKRLVDLAVKLDPDLEKVNLASGDKFVDRRADREKLYKEWNCDIVDMEGASIALCSYLFGVECLMIKAVSDTLETEGQGFYENFERASRVAVKLIDDLILNL